MEQKVLQTIGEKHIVSVDENGALQIAGPGSPINLDAHMTYNLMQFLESVKPLTSVGMGVSRFGSRIRVWRPEIALELAPSEQKHLWYKHPGLLFRYGILPGQPHSAIHYGGYTQDTKLFVLVPEDIYHVRYMECLLLVAREQTQSDDVKTLAAWIETANDTTGDKHDYWAVYTEKAEQLAREVSYWLELAGDRPDVVFDQNDVRKARK